MTGEIASRSSLEDCKLSRESALAVPKSKEEFLRGMGWSEDHFNDLKPRDKAVWAIFAGSPEEARAFAEEVGIAAEFVEGFVEFAKIAQQIQEKYSTEE
jgi:hypothetical protein